MAQQQEIILRNKKTGVLARVVDAFRGITLGPYNTKDAQLARLFGGSPSSSGVAVNEQTALNFSAVWAAVNLIAGDIGALPLEFYKRINGEGKEKFRAHPLYRVLHDSPNPRMGSSQFRRTMQQNKLVWGNAYAEIIRDGSGTPRELWPLAPWLMDPRYDGNVLYYVYRDPSGRQIEFDPIQLIHLRGPAEDGICGMSAIRAGRDSIGLSIAADRYAGTLFRNGLNVGGAITYPAGVRANDQTRKENRERIEKMHTGVDNGHRFLTLYEGATFTQFELKPDDAQMLESRQFQIAEIARWFGVPPHKIGDLEHATYSNIEQQERDYINALEPHLQEWEQELTIKLIRPLEQQQQLIEFVLEGRLRGDSSSRSELQSRHFSLGMLTPNEGRSLENRNPIDGGDQAFVSLQNIPIDMSRDYWQADIELKRANAEKAKQPPPAPVPPNNDGEMKALREALDLARSLTQKAEDARDLTLAALDVEKQQHAETRQKLDEAEHWRDEYADVTNRDGVEIEELKTQLEAAETIRVNVLNDFVQTALALREAESAVIGITLERDDKIEAATKIAQLATQREQERDAAITERDLLQTERDDLAARLVAAASFEETVNSLRVELETEQAKNIAAAEALNGETVRATALQSERDSAKIKLGETENALSVANLRISTLEGDIHKLESGASAQRQQIEDLTQREKDVILQNESLAADLEAARTDLARAQSTIATERDKQRTHKSVLLSAMRSLFVDATERLLYRESERARKNQQTPDKLRSHIERFYPMHEEHVRAAFQPLVGPWTAITGGAPGALLDKLVAEHVDSSRKGLWLVLESDNPDEVSANLERTLMRWEKERADAMADALVREGMAG